jgi:hypothetical protein
MRPNGRRVSKQSAGTTEPSQTDFTGSAGGNQIVKAAFMATPRIRAPLAHAKKAGDLHVKSNCHVIPLLRELFSVLIAIIT